MSDWDGLEEIVAIADTGSFVGAETGHFPFPGQSDRPAPRDAPERRTFRADDPLGSTD